MFPADGGAFEKNRNRKREAGHWPVAKLLGLETPVPLTRRTSPPVRFSDLSPKYGGEVSPAASSCSNLFRRASEEHGGPHLSPILGGEVAVRNGVPHRG